MEFVPTDPRSPPPSPPTLLSTFFFFEEKNIVNIDKEGVSPCGRWLQLREGGYFDGVGWVQIFVAGAGSGRLTPRLASVGLDLSRLAKTSLGFAKVLAKTSLSFGPNLARLGSHQGWPRQASIWLRLWPRQALFLGRGPNLTRLSVSQGWPRQALFLGRGPNLAGQDKRQCVLRRAVDFCVWVE